MFSLHCHEGLFLGGDIVHNLKNFCENIWAKNVLNHDSNFQSNHKTSEHKQSFLLSFFFFGMLALQFL